MKNLLNNLLNWVLKKGSSETKKDQAWEEKEQAGSKKDQVKRTKLSEKDQVKRTKLEKAGSDPISLRAIRYAAVLFMVLMVGVGQMWGTDNEFTCPTSGSLSAQYVYKITGTNSSLDGNKLYYSTSGPANVSGDFGLEATKLGLVFKPSENCKMTVKMSNNNSSASSITAVIYKIYKPSADTYIYPLYTNNVDADAASAVVTAVGASSSSSDATGNWWKNIKILKYSSSKWQVDGSNAKKTLSGEAIPYRTVYDSLFQATTLSAASTKSDKSQASVQTIQNSGEDYVFQKDTVYLVYCHRANSKVGFFTITFEAAAASCTAPNHVDITGNYHFYPGETLELTATAYSSEGTGSPITTGITGYQWQKYIGSTWTNIAGETSSTYTKANATTSDVGQYRCIVSTGATCSTTSDQFNVKCLQLYVYYNNKTTDKGNMAFTKVDGTHATASFYLELGSYDFYFKITDGCGNWWGNTGKMNSGNHDNWSLGVNSPCGLTTTKAATYVFNLTHNSGLTTGGFYMSVVYPAGDQGGTYDLYFANEERQWTADKIYYRIGKADHNQNVLMTKVDGTANLYHASVAAYNSFLAWHVSENCGWSGSNSIYKTKNLGDYTINRATFFEGAPVPSGGITVIPGSDSSYGSTGGSGGSTDNANDNCSFYSFTTVPGMWTHTATISDMTNGSVRLNWTDVSGAAQNATSTTAGLAHTCNLTITALPATGYETATLTVDGSDHTSGTVHVLDANATIAATYDCIVPEAPSAAKITATDGCGAGATFSADLTGLPSYVTWYWQTSSSGTSTTYPASSSYTTDAAAGSKTIYLRAKNNVCGEWSTSSASKRATVRTPVTASWNTQPADGVIGGSMTASVTTNYSTGLSFAVTSASPSGCVTVNAITGAISYVAAGTARITATVTGSGDYCSTASVYKDITVKCSMSYDGNSSTGGSVPTDASSPYAKDTRVVVKEPGTLSRTNYTFVGWNTAANGSGTWYSPGANFAITANTTLHAQWRSTSGTTCPGSAGGTVFSLSMGSSVTSSDLDLAAGETKNLSSYATITNGAAHFTNIHTESNGKAKITKDSPNKLSFKYKEAMLVLYLDCALEEGDEISFTGEDNQISFTTTPSRSTTPATTSKSYTIPAESSLIGAHILYVWRSEDNRNPNITALTITRPSDCTTPDAPDGLAAGSISSSGVTFTITDDESPASYEIYYSTSSTSPTGSTVASTTTTSKTKAVTGLTANTTYYAWVRAVCNDDYKSDWVALTGSTFKTLAAGTKYYLFTPTSAPNPSHTGTLSGAFISPSATSSSETIDTYTFTKNITFGGTLSSISGNKAGDKNITYYNKTSSTKFTLYVKNTNGSQQILYINKIVEGETSVTVANCTIPASTAKSVEYTYETSDNTTFAFSVGNTQLVIYQIVAEEAGTAHKVAGENGYALNLNKGRVACPLSDKADISVNGFLIKAPANNYKFTNSAELQIDKDKESSSYIKFTTPASPGRLKLTYTGSSGVQMAYNTSASDDGATSITSATAYTLSASTTYYLVNTGTQTAKITKIEFTAPVSTYNVSAVTSTGTSTYGTVSAAASTLAKDATTTITAVPATGYKVTNWAVSGTGASISPSGASNSTTTTLTMGTADATVTVTFGVESYTLAWSSNGGSDLDCDGCTSGSTAYGASITAPTDPTLSNYTFDGWKTNDDGTGSGKASTMPASDVTYYAAWKQTVTLKTGSQGSGSDQTPYVYLNGTGVSSITPHTADGYTLQGYYTAGSGGVKVLNADGTFAAANVTDYITSSKWSRTGAAPTLYAQWVAAEDCSTSDFVIKKGDDTEYQGCMESSSYNGTATSFTAGSPTTVGNAKMTISNYDGGIKRPGSGNTFSIVIEPVSGYYLKSICWAGKVENDETVSYYWDDNSGSATTITPQTTSGTGVTYNAPSSTTKFTASYVDDGDKSGGIWWRNVQVEVCAGGATTYNVAYDDNGKTGGSVPTDNTNYDYGGTVTVKGNTGELAKTNYTFAGWTTNNDGTGSSYVADNTFSITANTTLYAKWTQAVTFDANTANHGSTGGSATAVWNATGLTGITHATPASGYKLLGYYTTASGDGTKVLNADGTFAATAIDGYVTSSKWSRTGAAATLYARYESAGSLIWNLSVNTDATSLTTSSKTSAFTEISTSNMSNATLAGELTYEKSKKSSLTGKISTPSSYDADDYVYVTFQVASGYKFTPSSVKVIAQPVTSAKSVKLVLEDESSHSINFTTASTISGGSTQTVEMTNGSSVYFEGTVTLKIYCYGATDKYRLGTPITIEGEIEEACATMPSFTRLSYGETSYTVGDTPDNLEVIGGTNITTYAWKQNEVNDRSGGSAASGTNNTATYTPPTSSAGTMYYWCEMTNLTCGITIKTSAVGITVNEDKADASVTWDSKAKYNGYDTTAYYGGKNYTLKATLNSGWDGTLTADMFTAPSGIRLHDFTIDNSSNPKTITATFDILTTFDVDENDKIAFTLSLPATTSYNALSSEKNLAYNECSGGGEGSSYNIRMRKTITKDGNYYHSANADGWISPNISSSHSTAKSGTTMATVFDTVASSNTQYVWVRTYHANIKKVRIYANFRADNMTVSNVYKHTGYFTADSKYAVDYTAVYNGDEEDENLGTEDFGFVDITLNEVMAANDVLLVKFSTDRVRPLGAVITEGSVGSLTTSLAWSPTLSDGGSVVKTQSSANFTYTASPTGTNSNTLGAVTYSSSNTSCATVNATTGEVSITASGASDLSTTITAKLAASGCFQSKSITYIISVEGVSCTVETGTLTSDVTSKCSTEDATLTLAGFESGATLQWYKGESTISDDATYDISDDGTTLVTKEAGTYSVMVTNATCSDRSNSITISNKSASASVTKIVDEWYVKNGRLTPDIELWSLSEGATLGSVAWSPSNETGLECIERDGIIYLEGKEPVANESGADIVYTLTATILDACLGEHVESSKTITITHQKNTDKHVLAFVVNGKEKGGFTEGLTAAQTTDVPLYKTIATNFDVQATNCYASDDEKKVKQYYSQYDILCITDYPNSNKTGANSKKYVDVLGKLIDVRPILTMEAFVSDKANWKAKGISGTPQSPTTRQYSMLLQCKDHEIFSGTDLVKVGEGDETMYRVTMVAKDSDDYKTLDETYGAGAHAEKSGYEYGSKPALQGFTFSSEMLEDGLLPLGLIDDGAGNDLQVGIERQAEMSARLMVLGVNSYAMERLTKDGQKVIINALNYLMKKKEEEIADCSITFIGGDETKPKDWETASNWKGGQKPDKTTREIRILAPVVITSEQNIHAQAPIKIASGGTYNDGADNATGKITIEAGGALRVDGEIQAVTAPAYSKARPTSVGDIHIKSSSENGNGTLIFKNDEGTSQAIVEMYSKASFDGVNVSWQYIAVPFATTETAYENYYGSWLYRWAEDCSGWEVIPNRGDVGPWIGYCITQVGTKTYTMTGKLVETTTQEFSVPAGKEMVIGNSWTAPIQVKQFTDDDFSGLAANVYLFNTGYDPNGTGYYDKADRYEAGTYVTVPIHSSPYTGDSLISSLQAFIVNNTAGGSAQTLTLDYDRHVRPTRATDKVNAGQMHAPVRRAVVADGEPEVLKLFVSGSRYDDRLVVLAREDFSAGFDNGWDGQNINEQGDAPMMYALREDGTRDAVSAVPEFEGTVVGFQAGEDDVYTMSFVYAEEAEPLYILDTDNETYTRVLTDNTYTFMTSDKDAHSRFVLTRTSGMRNPTGCENVDGGVKAKKFILNDKMYIMVNGVMYDATGKLVK